MIPSLKRYFKAARIVALTKSSSRASEIARLMLHRLVTGYGPDHYIVYSLYDQPVNIRAWKQYLDKRDFCKMLFRYNKKEHFRVLEDKVLFGEACLQHNLPHPKILFACNYKGSASTFINLQDVDTILGFNNLAAGDYIVKTCSGSYGQNLWSVQRNSDGYHVHNTNQQFTTQQLAALLESTDSDYLIQEKIETAASLRPIMPGLATGGFRIYTFLQPDGTVVLPFCLVKLTVIGAISDNFASGKSGNLTAIVDMSNLKIRRVVGKSSTGLFCNITHHPDTGIDLRNYPVPEVQQALDLGRRCALAFPRIPAVGWDIVVSDQGAVVLEGNPMFDPYGPQWCLERGIKEQLPKLLGRDSNAIA